MAFLENVSRVSNCRIPTYPVSVDFFLLPHPIPEDIGPELEDKNYKPEDCVIAQFHIKWRRFNFFDLHDEADSGKIAEVLQDTTVSVVVSGNAHMVVCDVIGWVHLVSRAWNVTSFKAYELTVSLAYQLQHEPFLVTIGDDESGVNPILKVWDWSRTDRHGNPTCVRVSRAVPSHMRPTAATSLAVHENKSLLAVGFEDGSVSLFRGDVTRQRSSKMRTLAESGNTPITGLAFKGANQLFVASRSSVMVFTLSGGGTERSLAVDGGGGGAAFGCSVLADQNYMVARSDAIYCYTTDGRGPCYALEGEKLRLDWFRSHLVITTAAKTPGGNHVTILDIQNKFIVFSRTFNEIDAVVTEWGSFYILTKNKEVLYLEEKDLQSKLYLLFKKNLFDVAIRIASSQHYDVDGLTEIYKNYGDHLYAKGDLKGAIEQYVKTIGRLETSYVIRKYLESRHLEPLIFYLQELHKKGQATEDHTTLLLTCFVKLDQHDQSGKLREFIDTNDGIDFDVDIAIKVVRQASPDDALLLAGNNKRHDCYLRILTEDKKDFARALRYIADLEFDDAEQYMRKYGNLLMQNAPDESTELLKLICTDYKPRSRPLVDEAALSGRLIEPDRASPDDYIHLFLDDSRRLVSFLEHTITAEPRRSKLVYNALVEHYIHVWSKCETSSEKAEYEARVMRVLQSPDSNYDKDQTLIICQMLGFKPGILYLYEESKLWRSQLELHLRGGDAEGALGVCRRRGAACPQLWLDMLWSAPPSNYLPELLDIIARERLQSPTLVIDSLASSSAYTLGDVRKYLMNVLKCESDTTHRERQLAQKYRAETERMKAQIHSIQHEPTTFQNSRCTACNQLLELPTVHFLCQHSYHQHCFQSVSEEESECPACATRPGAAAAPAPSAEQFHSRLQKEQEPYSVVSEYFGRGLFNKLTVVSEAGAGAVELQPLPVARVPPPASAPAAPAAPTAGPGAESRQRLREGHTRDVYFSDTTKSSKSTGVVPIPESKMRQLERPQYSSSLEANLSRRTEERRADVAATERITIGRTTPMVHAKQPAKRQGFVEQFSLPSSASSSPREARKATKPPLAANPFEEDDENYDESKNPFASDSEQDPKNPFGDDDYDKNLNPFS